MKITFNWLREFVDFSWSPDQLAERLTMLGLEVEAVQPVAGEFDGIVVAQVLTRDPVPGSDKLSVCKVNDGRGVRTIICGAQNNQPGDKVALILPGHALPMKPGDTEPFVIKERKVFGILSQGMMCSPRELGLAEDAEGLLILRPDARVGQPFAEYLGRTGGDVVYDLEITPNRGDLNSVLGIAREIAALTGNPLRVPDVAAPAPGSPPETPPIEQLVAVQNEAPDLCPRYTTRVIRGVKLGPSPDWLRRRLELVGVRSLSNVVDVTNYVMLECGQPLHAFDYRLIAPGPDGRPTIIVRRAQDGELFITLDGQKRTLSSEMLLIADPQKGIALAGIMGGQNTEITEQTVDVLLESAAFHPPNIRRTSRALGLRSESSYRFERGVDLGRTDWASQRAVRLILDTAGGQLAPGVGDDYPRPPAPVAITLRFARTDALLGVPIPPAQQIQWLTRLGLETVTPPEAASPGASVTFRVPTWRWDLKREADLIEEIERLHGVDNVPATPPRGAIGAHPFDAVHDQIAEVRRILTGQGLHEAQGQTLIAAGAARRVAPEERLVRLANPLSSDMNTLRPSLLPGLLDSLRHNVSHKNYDVALFEVGRVFLRWTDPEPGARPQSGRSRPNAAGPVREERRVAVALTGQRQPTFWSGSERGAKFDFADLKGVIEELLEQWGVRGVRYVPRPAPTDLFLESAVVQLGKLELGELGRLQPALARQHDLRDAVWLAELNLDLLLARRAPTKAFTPLPAFPAIRRDVALLVAESVTHEAVLQVIDQARPAHLETVELFDVFRGKNVPECQKSLAYALTYRSAERTLTDAEVNAIHEKLVAELKHKLPATIREG